MTDMYLVVFKKVCFSCPNVRKFFLKFVKLFSDMHIGIAGNIGAGKTTLTRMLSEHYGWIPKYESVTYNPYLEDYYKDIKRWSYNLETYFLAQRFRDLVEISKSDDIIIQDRTLMEGVNIFVANNVAMDNLSQRDYETYLQLYNLMMSMVREPDLLIYLRSSIEGIVRKIQKRGRDYEQGLSVEYLGNLNRLYEQWISNYKGRIIIFDVDNLDYENNPQDFALITDRLDSELFGLFRQ